MNTQTRFKLYKAILNEPQSGQRTAPFHVAVRRYVNAQSAEKPRFLEALNAAAKTAYEDEHGIDSYPRDQAAQLTDAEVALLAEIMISEKPSFYPIRPYETPVDPGGAGFSGW